MTTDGKTAARITSAEEYEIWGLLSQLNDAIFKARENELAPFGLTAVQVGVMYVVRMLNSKGIQTSPSEISRWVFREPHTTSALLHRMEKQGLVKLKKTSRGKRQLRAELTEKGEELYRRQVEARQVIPEILDVLSPEERQQFRAFLERLRRRALEKLVVRLPFP